MAFPVAVREIPQPSRMTKATGLEIRSFMVIAKCGEDLKTTREGEKRRRIGQKMPDPESDPPATLYTQFLTVGVRRGAFHPTVWELKGREPELRVEPVSV